jgi:hypothetical protein
MTFWYGSGFADPYLCLTDLDSDLAPDPDLDPGIFASDLYFFCFEATFT